MLFQTTNIQTFESNSQPTSPLSLQALRCFRLQRYKILKAIHNSISLIIIYFVLFQTTKIQTFESNSQLDGVKYHLKKSCFRLRKYKLLKAIHNCPSSAKNIQMLFQTIKIQTFESNSQRYSRIASYCRRCFRLQRYKLSQSNSQHLDDKKMNLAGCFRLQRYKFLKTIYLSL